MSKHYILQKKAYILRKRIIEMIFKAGSGHSGGSLSAIEILTVLYNKVLNIKPGDPNWQDRDRFILSKGHAAPALYAVMADVGYLKDQQLDSLREFESCLQGHPCMFRLPGIDMSTGSLGMGLSVGVGMALSAKAQKRDFNVYVLCGDGELQEGQNWEAMMAAAKWNLDNLILIVDRNHVQLDGTQDDIMPMGCLEDKIKSFEMNILTCDGHNVDELVETFDKAAKRQVLWQLLQRL